MTPALRIVAAMATLAAFCLTTPAPAQTPLGAAFTYQGYLGSGGTPLAGDADFRFSLWDDPGAGDPPTGGTQLGPTHAFGGPGNPPPITVSEGHFKADLDFGSSVFEGDARWLQIAVRHPAWDGSGAEPPFTTLAPRQPLTPAPFAIKTLGVSPRRLAALETDGVINEIVGVSSPIEDCTHSGDGLDCQLKRVIELALAPDAPIVLQLTNPTETIRLEAMKRRLQPDATVHSFVVDLMIDMPGVSHGFSVSPADPVYNSKTDAGYQGTFHIIAMLDGVSRLLLWVKHYDDLLIQRVVVESPGYIVATQVDPYDEFTREATLRVLVINDGELDSNYRVSVTDCPPTVEMVPAQLKRIVEAETAEFVFTLHNSVPFTDADSCKVSMWSQVGKLYDFTTVDFPPPLGD